jgi:hypothetical protein
VRENLKRLMEWLGSDRKRTLAQAKDVFAKAAKDSLGRDEEKVGDYLAGKGILRGITRQALKYISERWGDGQEITRFRMMSGLTYAAQSFDPDRRYEIELQAGELLSV